MKILVYISVILISLLPLKTLIEQELEIRLIESSEVTECCCGDQEGSSCDCCDEQQECCDDCQIIFSGSTIYLTTYAVEPIKHTYIAEINSFYTFLYNYSFSKHIWHPPQIV